MREKAKRTKDTLCKAAERIWIAMSFACMGFIIVWLCIGVFFFGGVSLS